MPDGVDARVEPMEPPDAKTVRDGATVEAKVEQLASRHHPMLPSGERRDLTIERARGTFQ